MANERLDALLRLPMQLSGEAGVCPIPGNMFYQSRRCVQYSSGALNVCLIPQQCFLSVGGVCPSLTWGRGGVFDTPAVLILEEVC